MGKSDRGGQQISAVRRPLRAARASWAQTSRAQTSVREEWLRHEAAFGGDATRWVRSVLCGAGPAERRKTETGRMGKKCRRRRQSSGGEEGLYTVPPPKGRRATPNPTGRAKPEAAVHGYALYNSHRASAPPDRPF
jgi:hypothetical protein